MENIDLDRLVDYKAEYTAVIQKFKISGDNLLGLCPFHPDSSPSFSVNLRTGKWNCFTEGRGGNFVSFWAEYYLHDPENTSIAHGKEKGAELIRSLLNRAEFINLEAELTPEIIPGAPVNLRQPNGFVYSNKGIGWIDPKTMTPAIICRTPILLTKRLKSIENQEEKIEVAFKRDGEWSRVIYPRDTVFSSRGVLELAKHGCTITSENARQVVKFLGALEMENIDIIPKVDATSTFGWQTGGRFLPGKEENLVLDVDFSQRRLADAYCQNGTLNSWVRNMAPHRERDKFRFILAASFAAPLLRIVRQRNFFVFNWGGSRGARPQP